MSQIWGFFGFYVNAKRIFINAKRILHEMLRLTEITGNSLVANGSTLRENTLTKPAVVVDGVTTDLSIKTLLADDLSVYLISIKTTAGILLNFELNEGDRAVAFVQNGALQIYPTEKALAKTISQNTYYNIPAGKHLPVGISLNGNVNLCLICLKQHVADKLLSTDRSMQWPEATSAPTDPAMGGIINTVIRHAGEGPFHRIMLIAKTLELLFMSLKQLANGADTPERSAIRSADLEKLEAARALIARDLRSPCTLIELAHKVGLNDFKLKKGFKELYGNTVFGYLTDLRMEKAKLMIASAQYSIGEIAHEVGYKNGHHFTVAFKKKFGHVPSKAGAAAST